MAAEILAMNGMQHLDRLLAEAVDSGASDLHLIVGVPPSFRINGEIILANHDPVQSDFVQEVSRELLTPDQLRKFQSEWELCVSIPRETVGRIRVTFYYRNRNPELSVRFCSERIPSREELGLPAKMEDLVRRANGLILITGPTGAGKTTTLNYMIDLINNERRCKIVTIEDPIEFVHHNKRAIIVQQEVLTDTHSFNRALVHVLRQDPDVIVVGEMRDHETIATALTAAETGHLVIATLHSPSVSHALERIIGVYEGSAQRQIILQLATSLQAILAQDLLPSADRTRRVLAYELMVVTSAIRSQIRDKNFHQLENTIQTGAKDGMMLLDNCLYQLYTRCQISYDTALSWAKQPERFAMLINE